MEWQEATEVARALSATHYLFLRQTCDPADATLLEGLGAPPLRRVLQPLGVLVC